MLKRRALFVALEAYWPCETSGQTGAGLPPALRRVLSDHAAFGFEIVPIFASASYGLGDRDADIAFGGRVERVLRGGAGVRPSGIVAMHHPDDPQVLWDAARQFDLDLRRSFLLTEHEVHASMARTAGVARAVSLLELSCAVIAA